MLPLTAIVAAFRAIFTNKVGQAASLSLHRRSSAGTDRDSSTTGPGRAATKVGPTMPWEGCDLIRKMSRANPSSGAPRIHGELL